MNLKFSTISFARVLVWFLFSLSIGVFLRYVYFASYGFDFTDEGFYFNWYKYAQSFPAVTTFFGFIYSFPYRFFGENIPALRVFNISTVLAVGAWCVYQPFERMKGFEKLVGGPVTKAIFIFSLSTLSLLILVRYSSPSYNHLAFIGCLLVTGALLKSGPLEESPQVLRSSFGLPLISGIIAASLAKPTTGFVLGLVCLSFAFSLTKTSRRWMILWLALSLVLTTCISILFFGSPSELFSRVTLGKEWAFLMDAGHNPSGLVLSIWTLLRIPPPLVVMAWVFVFQVIFVFSFLTHGDKYGLLAKQFLIAFSLSLAFSLFANYVWFLSAVWLQIGYIWLVVLPFSFLVLFVISTRFYPVNCGSDLPTKRLLVGLFRLLLILLISFAFGFGSNNALWSKIFTISIIFVSVAAAPMSQLSFQYAKRLFIAFLLCLSIGELLLLPAHARFFLKPFRQDQPLFLNNNLTQVGPASQLFLSDGFSEYINNARNALLLNGFKSGSPLLDFSGLSPGLIYAVDGRPIGQPWMIGGTKGSNALARAAVAKIPCNDLYSSWIIIQPKGPSRLDLSILEDIDIDIYDESRYERVAELRTPTGSIGNNAELFIYKPLLGDGHRDKCISWD